MNMSFIDWMIPVVAFALLLAISIGARFLNKSVADFLAANRMAGRYLLAIGSGMTGLGAISIAANFEKYYQVGFAAYWWGKIVVPVALIIALSGFVIYRFRETRALTMAQFFEIRYSRRFRVFSGFLAWASGILNYGIFPAVSARFLIYFIGLPESVGIFGFTVPMLAIVMLVLLSLALTMVLFGGQISIMITDMLQGQFVNIAMLLILAILFWNMPWSEVIEGLRHAPEGQSRINPFKQQNVTDFNVWFFMMMAAISVYPEPYVGVPGLSNQLWNRPFDNKHYLRIHPPAAIGDSFRLRNRVIGFSATEADWIEVGESVIGTAQFGGML